MARIENTLFTEEDSTIPPIPFDTIPQDIFLGGEYTPERIAAIKQVREIGTILAAEYADLGEHYRDVTVRQIDIAAIYIPQWVEANPEIAKKAIGYALKQLLPSQELADLTAVHRKYDLEQKVGQAGSEERSKHNTMAAQARHDQGIGVDVEAMIRGRRITPWAVKEVSVLIALLEEIEYQRINSVTGRISYHWEKLAESLNIAFHDDTPLRTGKNVYDVVRHYKQGIKRGV